MCRLQREDGWHVSGLVTDCHLWEINVKMVMPVLLYAPTCPFLDRIPASNCVKKSREKLLKQQHLRRPLLAPAVRRVDVVLKSW